jgi:ferritin-like metal-binding protein YciE
MNASICGAGIVFLYLKKNYMEKLNDLKALLQHEVQDLVSAEDQIIESMPLMIAKVQNEELRNALQEHLAITEKQRKRLDEVQDLLNMEENKGFIEGLMDKISGAHKCKGMEGIITEGQKIITADMDPDVKDAAIIACAQKIEHYEICGYGTVKAYAIELNLPKAEHLFEETLNEEYEADNRLTRLAVGYINEEAEDSSDSTAGKPKSRNGKTAAAPKKAAAKKTSPSKKAAAKKATAKK